MSPIVARSVASLYGCKPNLKNWRFRSVCYASLWVVGVAVPFGRRRTAHV